MATFRRSRIVEGSCWTCRRRRIKCDLNTPTCGRCYTSGQDCNYGAAAPIKWVGGAAMRGRYAPAQTPNNVTAMISPPPSPTLDTEALVLYFSNAVLPRYQLMEETLPLDLNLVMEESLLQQAVLAVSQGHYDMYSHATSNSAQLRRQRARQKAIQSLRRRLAAGVSPDDSLQLFAANVLFCMLDGMIVIQPGELINASMCHLKGGYAILQSNPPTDILMASGLQAHLLSVFATMDLVHALLSGERPYFEPLLWHMFSETQAWWGRLQKGDRFLTLLKAFSEMACLGQLASHLSADDGVSIVDKCLPAMEFTLNTSSQSHLTSSTDSSASKNWDTFCSLYQLTGIIYLQRALRLRPVDDEVVQAATKKGVEKLLDEALPGMMAHCVIFPILVLGAHCIHSQDRQAVVKALSPSITYLSFGNLMLIEELWKVIWSKSDVQATWWESFSPVADRAFLF